MNTASEVDAWFQAYDGPQKANMMAVRSILLGADARLTECVKWQAPTFVFNGNMASFNPRATKAVSLMFHHGATIPGDHPLLKGDGAQARSISLASAEAVQAAASELAAVVRAWCDSRG